MRNLSYCLIFLFCSSILKVVCGQTNPPQVNLPSPNAASLGVFNEFPSISATGVPDISIPLYELNYKGIKVPIYIQYNNNLVKPDMRPGWVGLGWNLFCGGSINRVIYDVADEDNLTAASNSSWHRKGYYYNHDFFSVPNWASDERARAATDERFRWFTISDRWLLDSRPDEFSFSFLNFKGSFFLDENGNWRVRSDNKLTVEMTNSFKKFTITDTNGTKYVFGSSNSNLNSIETSAPFIDTEYADSYSFYNYYKTWNLTQISTINGDVIDFVYETGSTINVQPYWHFTYASTGQQIDKLQGSRIKTSYLTQIVTPTAIVSLSRSNSQQLKFNADQFESHRKFSASNNDINIPFMWLPNGSATSRASLESRLAGLIDPKLDYIAVESKIDSKQIEKIIFEYTNSSAERLKLKSISRLSQGNYQFQYTNDFDPTLKLPNYCNMQIDKYGFYNARVPNYTSASLFFASKEPDPLKLQCELLKRITYPTKGYTDYIFTANEFKKEVSDIRYDPLIINSSNKIGAGVRINEIHQYDHNDQLTNSRRYFYTTDYTPSGPDGISSGILNAKTYFTYMPPQLNQATGSGDIYSRGPLFGAGESSFVMYSKVTEVFPNNSYTVRTFSALDNGIDNEYMDKEPIYRIGVKNSAGYISKAFERGFPLTEKIYKVEDLTSKLIHEKDFSYVRLNEEGNYIRAYDIWLWNNTSVLRINVYPYLISKVDEITYDQADPGNSSKSALQSVTYDYTPIGQSLPAQDLFIRKTTQINPDGQKIITENKYISEYSVVADPIGDPGRGINFLKQNNIDNALIQSLTYLQKDENGSSINYLLSGSINTYKVFQNSKAYPWQNYKLKVEQGETFTNFNWSSTSSKAFLFGSSKFKLQNTCDSYDDNGNLLSFTGEDGISTSYTWGYNNTLITSKTVNPDQTSYFTHRPLVGVLDITDPNGIKSYYEYDPAGRLSVMKDDDHSITTRKRYQYRNQNDGFTATNFTVSGDLISDEPITLSSIANPDLIGASKYIWDFGDGNVLETGSYGNATHIYDRQGTFTVKLVKINPEYRGSVTSTKTIVVFNPVVVNINVPSDVVRCLSGSVTCSIVENTTGGGCSALSYLWQVRLSGTSTWYSFGNGYGSSVSINPQNFPEGGYEIKCIASDTCGHSDEKTTMMYLYDDEATCN